MHMDIIKFKNSINFAFCLLGCARNFSPFVYLAVTLYILLRIDFTAWVS